MQDIFTDIFSNIVVTGNIVRIELATLKTPGGDNKEPEFQVAQRLVMPIEGFIRSFGMTEEVVKRMLASGVIQKRDPEAAPVPGTVEAPAPVEITSPNFKK